VVWALSFATMTWSRLAPTGTAPHFREGHTAIYDPVRDRMIIYGGQSDAFSAPFNDAWALSLSGTPAWAQIQPSGTLPTGRAYHGAVYDPVRDRMVVFGGSPDLTNATNFLNDVSRIRDAAREKALDQTLRAALERSLKSRALKVRRGPAGEGMS
jgi:hypothetical protein